MDSPSVRIAFTTLGCKVNQSETDLLARQFAAAGYRCVPFEGAADVYVVNTCTVTHVADRKSRQVLNAARRRNPSALIVATGCYASIVGQALSNDRTLVIRPRDKDRVVDLVSSRLQRTPTPLPYFADTEKYLAVSGGQERSRAMVKVQDGCDSHCTYCIIPRARGRSRSVPAGEVVRRVNALVAEGHVEVVITGVDLGSYDEDGTGSVDLGVLLQRLLHETAVPRLRISSLEPGDFNLDWLDLWSSNRLCRHLHLPLQSGSSTVLQRMQRAYDPSQYAAMVAACRTAIPEVTITTDILTGFPGETEEEFVEGRDFARTISFEGMHVFKYSLRSGTRAAHMPDQVAEAVKAERSRLLREDAAAGIERLIARHAGSTVEVAWEGETGGVARGLTDTNVRVYGPPLAKDILSIVQLSHPYRDGLWAVPARADIPLIAVAAH